MTEFDTAWSTQANPHTGGYLESFPGVKERVMYHVNLGATNIWIGIASNGQAGCRARWNAKYKGLGLNYMAPIYTSTSDDFRKGMEKQVVEWCMTKNGEPVKLDNEIGGGGGPEGTAPYYVYIAYKKPR